MQQKINLSLSPLQASDHQTIVESISQQTGKLRESITGFHILKRSLDARSKLVKINLTLLVFIDEPFAARELQQFHFKNVANAKHTVIVIGAGPAGLFAALKLIEHGIKPIILERGKDVKARRRDLAALNKHGIVNPESNYCFGEGGAGTYSDGKLYTRSNKRGDINRILHLFVRFGAEENILYEAHPHIGTNKLPQIITAIRQQLIDCGAAFLFDEKVIDFVLADDKAKQVKTTHNSYTADAIILATGHSARDIFQLLHYKKIAIEAKPFALGVRIEHPQELINNIQYHSISNNVLPPASYSLVEQVYDKGVFSFCMCPGGIIAPAATNTNEIVVNGWSPSKRNNPFANSGIVVTVEEKDAHHFFKEKKLQPHQNDPLLLMQLQEQVEQQAYISGGGALVAPAQRITDFCNNKTSETLPACSYLPGVHATNLQQVLPGFVYKRLQEAFKVFGKKMKGYYTSEAIIVATESRTSSPVRIPRDAQTLQHTQIKNLYPCGEGAGYAGGIISAAMDGENVAAKIIAKLV